MRDLPVVVVVIIVDVVVSEFLKANLCIYFIFVNLVLAYVLCFP